MSTTAAAIVAGTPEPGIYQLRVGSGALGSPGATRSGVIPLSIAPFVDPSSGPLLGGTAPFTVHGTGFAATTEVLVGSVALAATTSPPQPGQVSVDASGTSFAFSPPPGPTGEIVAVRVRVNGIEAARRIRALVPESKIVFVSQESSADVVEEALSTGACGYVVKAKAGSELLAAIDVVILGKQLVP